MRVDGLTWGRSAKLLAGGWANVGPGPKAARARAASTEHTRGRPRAVAKTTTRETRIATGPTLRIQMAASSLYTKTRHHPMSIACEWRPWSPSFMSINGRTTHMGAQCTWRRNDRTNARTQENERNEGAAHTEKGARVGGLCCLLLFGLPRLERWSTRPTPPRPPAAPAPPAQSHHQQQVNRAAADFCFLHVSRGILCSRQQRFAART